MEEVFHNYKHYSEWIWRNWESDRKLDSLIIKEGLMIERKINLNGETHRMLTKNEFDIKNKKHLIKIPK